MKRSGILLTVALLCISLVATGIVLMISSLYVGKKAIYQENDTHLQDLVWSFDYSLSQTMNNWRDDLNYLVESEECRVYEKEFREGRNVEQYRKFLEECMPVTTGIANDILIREGDTILLSAKTSGEHSYRIQEDSDGDGILFCTDDNGLYLGMTVFSPDGTLEYIVLIEAEQFYEKAIDYYVSEGNHTILYDGESGLLMFKKSGSIYCRQLKTTDTSEIGNTLYQLLGTKEGECESPTEFEYTDDNGNKSKYRIVIIPESLTENGTFMVAVAEKIEGIVRQINIMMSQAICSVMFLLIGTTGLAIAMLYNRRHRTEMMHQLEDLEEKNKLTADYVEQQKALAHHQRLEVVGTLTAGIAHEFNNLLTPIMGYSLMLLEKISPDDEENYDSILEIYNASQKAKTIVSRLSNLTRKPKNELMQSISPDRLVEKVRSLASSTCPNNVKTILELKAGDATVEGDETRLTQMLLNLVLNACQAMEKEGGILSVSTGVQNDRVWIKVADTGKGIPKELEQKIFEPFFTTKEAGKGTGLGLAVVHSIVQDAGGTIEVENRPTGGCCFTVYLNRNDKLGDHYYSKANIEPPLITEEL